MDGPIRGYKRICDEHLAQPHGGKLDPVWDQKFLFGLILKELCDFSGSWYLRY